MFDRDLMERADDRSLQETPDVLHGVSVDVATGILSDGMVDCLMDGIFVSDAPVGSPVVGVDGFGIIMDGFIGESVEGLAAPVWDNFEDDFAVALYGSHNDSLVALAPVAFAPDLATDKGLVDFNDALEFDGRSVGDSGPDTMAKIPSRLVRDIERPLQLAGRDSFLGFNHQVDGHEPFVEGQVGVMKHGSSGHGEVVFAILTDELMPLIVAGYLDASTPETRKPIRPPKGFKILPAPIF